MKIQNKYSSCFNGIDRAFAGFMAGTTGDYSTEFILACMFASNAIESGDTCADIRFLAGKKLTEIYPDRAADITADENIIMPEYGDWIKILKSNCGVSSEDDATAPLVLDSEGRLYLNRYYSYERAVAEKIKLMAAAPDIETDKKILADGLNRLFPAESGRTEIPDLQTAAAVTSLYRPLCVISGGPGTGKTFAVAKILALLIEQYLASGSDFRAVLCAPTGKAAARLKESISSAAAELDIAEEVRKLIPTEAATIHRLLGTGYNHSNNFRRKKFPECDCVVVDESSMMDIRIAAALMESVPDRARLILLGDSHQLSSVEAGAVFASVSSRAEQTSFTPAFVKKISSIYPAVKSFKTHESAGRLCDSIIVLTRSYRFNDRDGIKIAADCVKSGDTEALLKLLDSNNPQVKLIETNKDTSDSIINQTIAGEYSQRFIETDPVAILESMKKFTILCALRNGPAGVEGLNATAEKVLSEKKLINPARGKNYLYHGMPVMITANDYSAGLFNGDTGIIISDQDSGKFFAAFKSEASDSGYRKIPVSMLPPYEKVYAMTVHKSQGSEFDRVALVLPDKETPVLTRELIYTAITRARSTVTIFGSKKILISGITNPTVRRSGLSDSLRV